LVLETFSRKIFFAAGFLRDRLLSASQSAPRLDQKNSADFCQLNSPRIPVKEPQA
jgi:hypothetical protein